MVCVIVDIDVVKVFNYMAGSNSMSVQYERVAQINVPSRVHRGGSTQIQILAKSKQKYAWLPKNCTKTFTLKLQPIQRRSCRWQFDWRRCAGKLNFCSGFTRTMFRTNTTIQYNGFMRTLFRRNTTIAQVFTRAIYSVYKDYGNTNSVNLF